MVLGLLLAEGCAHRAGPAPSAVPGASQAGIASWYGEPFHGRRTASGEVYDMYQMTAAHKKLPFGTMVRVTRRDTRASTVVRINDRGPFVRGRIIDLSLAAAREIGLDLDGVAPVRIEVIGARERPQENTAQKKAAAPEVIGCWWVQVGAFGDRDNAEKARERLERAGEPVAVTDGPRGLRRVRVGPFDSRDEVEAALLRLRAEWPPATVVRCTP